MRDAHVVRGIDVPLDMPGGIEQADLVPRLDTERLRQWRSRGAGHDERIMPPPLGRSNRKAGTSYNQLDSLSLVMISRLPTVLSAGPPNVASTHGLLWALQKDAQVSAESLTFAGHTANRCARSP